MTIAYTLYLTEPLSRNLDAKVDADAVEMARLEDLHKIDYLMQSMAEDLAQLLPAGWSIETVKETP